MTLEYPNKWKLTDSIRIAIGDTGDSRVSLYKDAQHLNSRSTRPRQASSPAMHRVARSLGNTRLVGGETSSLPCQRQARKHALPGYQHFRSVTRGEILTLTDGKFPADSGSAPADPAQYRTPVGSARQLMSSNAMTSRPEWFVSTNSAGTSSSVIRMAFELVTTSGAWITGDGHAVLRTFTPHSCSVRSPDQRTP